MIMSAGISRSLLALPDLDLNNGTPFKVIDIKPGDRTWRRQETSSAYVDGEFTVNRTRSTPKATWAQEIRAADQDEMNVFLSEVVQAFEQDTFEIWHVMDGAETRWKGETADWQPTYEKERLHGLRQQIIFSFKRVPVPILGAV